MREGIRLLLTKLVKTTDTEKTGLSLENRGEETMVELSGKEAVQFFAKSVPECVSMEGKRVL